MNDVALELEKTLRRLDRRSAAALEQAVRGVLALAAERPTPGNGATNDAVDANGWPIGYFEKHVGALADDDWEPPADPPPEPAPKW